MRHTFILACMYMDVHAGARRNIYLVLHTRMYACFFGFVCRILNPELEFLNKCQIPVFWNPGIWGEGEFIVVLYNILKLVWDFQGSLNAGFVVNPANWYFTDPGSILSNITFTLFQLIKFVNNNSVNSISREKGRSWAKEPVWKSNPWISAPTKCLWISTLVSLLCQRSN
jgi:hypothetical protein